jgi:nitrous oxidase accessory protein NosD
MEPKSITCYAVVMGLLATMAVTAFSAVVPVAQGQEPQKDDENDSVKDQGLAKDDENDSVKDQGLGLSDSDQAVAACGVVVTEDITLNEDLECDGNGLIVGARDVTINLNGYTIRSDKDADVVDLTVDFDDNNGILVADANNVTIIGPGAISGFHRGITYAGSTGGQVTDTVLRDNKAAILMSGSSEISVTRNNIHDNKFAVVSESSEDGQVIFNLIAANEKEGIVLSDSDKYGIFGNNVFGNGKDGIFLDAQSFDNSVDLNNVFGHEDADINNANGLPTNINRNNFGVNNNCGLSLPGGLC